MPVKRFRSEVAKLENLYLASRYAFRVARDQLHKDIRAGEVDPEVPVDVVLDEGSRTITTGYELRRNLKDRYLGILRQTIFVRLISALEVFLIDTIKFLFLHRRDLFHRDDKIEFHYGELLSTNSMSQVLTKIIDRECRRVQNQGFKVLTSYYRKRLGIDFSKGPVSLSCLEEIHDRRHLIVHRLGKTDFCYRRKYSNSVPRLTVGESYLFSTTERAKAFVSFVSDKANQHASEPAQRPFKGGTCVVKLELADVSPDAVSMLDPGYHFIADDKVVCLRDIVDSHTGSETERTLLLQGEPKVVKQYIKFLRKLQKSGAITIQGKEELTKGYRCKLPHETVLEIAKMLPGPPFPRDVHKQIAQTFEISNKQASAAISLILEDEELFGIVGRKYKRGH